MSHLATQIKEPSAEDYMEELAQFPQQAAEAFRSYIQKADVEQYKNFLKMMYYYTLDSENKLQYAADKSNNDELRNYFLQMKKEETNHFLLAEKDYEGYGGTIDKNHTPPVVQAFDDFWYGLGKTDAIEFAGALYVFESIADYVKDDVKALLERIGATGKQSRWMRVHVEADEAHGSEALEICEKYISRNPEAILAAARLATKRWIAVFEEALR